MRFEIANSQEPSQMSDDQLRQTILELEHQVHVPGTLVQAVNDEFYELDILGKAVTAADETGDPEKIRVAEEAFNQAAAREGEAKTKLKEAEKLLDRLYEEKDKRPDFEM